MAGTSPAMTWKNNVAHHTKLSSPAKAGDSVFQRQLRLSREAAAYWVPRFRGG